MCLPATKDDKRKDNQSKKVAPSPCYCEEANEQGGRSPLCLRKGLQIFALDRTYSPKGTSTALSKGPTTFGYNGNELSSIHS